MAITNGYTDLDEFKNVYHEPSGYEADYSDDERLDDVITAVSRVIDHMTGRRFYVTSETRYYTALASDHVLVHDYTGITALKTDDDDDGTFETTWTTSDYHNMPLNAALDSQPYTWLEIKSNGSYSFPRSVRGVELQATFGYAATTPPMIKQACLLGVAQIWKRKDAVFGIAGTNALGLIQVVQAQLEKDPHFMMLIYPFVKQV